MGILHSLNVSSIKFTVKKQNMLRIGGGDGNHYILQLNNYTAKNYSGDSL